MIFETHTLKAPLNKYIESIFHFKGFMPDHSIERVDRNDFRTGIIDQCGRCHMDVTETYFETFHGKVTQLGSVKTAYCYDCHGSHEILPTYDQNSTLNRPPFVL